MTGSAAETVAPLAAIFGLNTKLFLNCLDGLTDAAARTRPNQQANNLAFIGGHLVETRAWMGRYLGLETPAPFGGVLEHATGIDAVPDLPPVAEIRSAWEAVSGAVSRRLDDLTMADLAAPSSQRFPGVAATIVGGIAFLVQHESYHVGQMAYVRKYLGLSPMSYR